MTQRQRHSPPRIPYVARIRIFHGLTMLACLIAMATGSGRLCAADTGAPTPRERNKARAAAFDATNRNACAVNTNLMVRPGLIADRAQRTVTIAAETIRLEVGKPVEFPLIAENSGKDYEALAISFAVPSDIHAALEFIGLQPGKGVDAAAMRFWPKGEPVDVMFQYDDSVGGTSTVRTVPASRLITDTRTGKPLPDDGFVFVGSARVPPPGSASGTGAVYAADVFSPNAIVTVFNEGTTVLDVPRRASQHEVYAFQVPNPACRLPDAGFAWVTLKPRSRQGDRPFLDFTLRAEPATNTPAGTATPIRWSLSGADRTVAAKGADLSALQESLAALAAGRKHIYVTIEPSDAMDISQLRQLAKAVETLEDKGLMRVEPPPAGHPYYKAFLPNEQHRQRANRPIQPWEFYIGSAGATNQLVYVEEIWGDNGAPSTYRETRHPVAAPRDIPSLLTQHDAPSVVLIFPASSLPYSALRPFLAPFIERRMIIYIFAADKP